MDTIIALQETKKVKRSVGDTRELKTSSKTVVTAINELYDKGGSLLDVYETSISYVEQNETRSLWIPFIKNGFIRGIKCSGHEHTGDFELSIFTKPQNVGGKYVYRSGIVNNILWDIMEIPFKDESGTNDIYVTLTNAGSLTTFNLQIFVRKGV